MKIIQPIKILQAFIACVLTGAMALSAPAQAQTFEQPQPVVLPRDEAPHHSQVEWWYFVGHLKGVDARGVQREFGYEVTVFQVWAVPFGPANYTWHFALTDVNKKVFRYEERTSFAPIPNQVNSFSFKNGDWSLGGSSQNYGIKARLSDNKFGIDLHTSSNIPFTIHGDNGVVPYAPFGTSAYYSSTALNTTGAIYENGQRIQVTGTSWQDRQWFNLQGTGGWNWFSIQLDNNTQYMLYFLQAFPSGDIVQKFGTKIVNGVSSPVDPSKMEVKAIDNWVSPKTGFIYPSKWQVSVPEGHMTVTPLVQNQELVWPGHRSYFEGASEVIGTLNGAPVSGRGYTEINPSFEPLVTLP